METYNASLDTFAKIATGFIFLLAIAGIAMIFLQDPWYGGLFLAVISLITLIPTYIYSVTSYQVADQALIINRPFSKSDKVIPYSEIDSAYLPDKKDFKWTIRTFGNGGIFGYYGYYANKKLGSFRMYATNRKNRIIVVLKKQHEKIVLSPDDIGMAEALQKHLKRPA
jgi:Bacterial PH domain